MATARQVIKKALRYIGKETSLKNATDADYSIMLDELNQLLKRWFSLGLRLAVNTNTIESLDGEVPYPDVALTAIEYNLAVQGWPLFNLTQPVSLTVMSNAADYENEIWAIGRPVPKTVFPGVLPTGSGNTGNRGWDRTFYPDCDEPIYGCDDNQLQTGTGIPLIGVDNE